jgi:O-acetyl-ADP-ribose deacetylase (regulator of RNase III)
MIRYAQGNLLDANTEALVNTVNTVGVMGKGIALQFKERFPDNFAAYAAAHKRGDLQIGKMFVTEGSTLTGRPWIINFPTKEHWRQKSTIAHVRAGLEDLVRIVRGHGIRSVAVPPLGCGNGGLEWRVVRQAIEEAFAEVADVDVVIYEPTDAYSAEAKRSGVEELTLARAILVDLIRKYSILGLDCSNLEVQKLAYVFQRMSNGMGRKEALNLEFKPHIYGPYADALRHALNALDGSYLHSEKRAADAKPLDVIGLDRSRLPVVERFLRESPDAGAYVPVLEAVDELIDGFQTPYLMELLTTVDMILAERGSSLDTTAIREAMKEWPAGDSSAARKLRLFDDRDIELARQRLVAHAEELYESEGMARSSA